MMIRADFDTIRDAALNYASRGWPVFPVPTGIKKSHTSAAHSDGRKRGATIDSTCNLSKGSKTIEEWGWHG